MDKKNNTSEEQKDIPSGNNEQPNLSDVIIDYHEYVDIDLFLLVIKGFKSVIKDMPELMLKHYELTSLIDIAYKYHVALKKTQIDLNFIKFSLKYYHLL